MDKNKIKEQNELNFLLSSAKLALESRIEAEDRGKEDSVKRLNIILEEDYAKIKKVDPNFDIDAFEKSVYGNSETIESKNENVYDLIGQIDGDKNVKEDVETSQNSIFSYENDETDNKIEEFSFDDDNKKEEIRISETQVPKNESYATNNGQTYDIFTLPSKGECYRNKIDKVTVGFLTAYDENLITSPNLYRDGLVIDLLLKNKVLSRDINVEELCNGDVDAIIWFLRVTSYGSDFPITVVDPKTGKEFDTTVDLSKLKFKPFNLKGDENGYFDFQLPKSKDNIKFKYLTRKEEKLLEKVMQYENNQIKGNVVKSCLNAIKDAIQTDDSLKENEKQKLLTEMSVVNKWANKLKEKSNKTFNKMITNRMEMCVVSVNGRTDREFIVDYVRKMSALDALHLRRYILDNAPGIDFEINVKRPESLGGGSFNTFLDWDDNVFLNIA